MEFHEIEEVIIAHFLAEQNVQRAHQALARATKQVEEARIKYEKARSSFGK